MAPLRRNRILAHGRRGRHRRLSLRLGLVLLPRAAFLEREQLLGAEGLVVDVGGGVDQVVRVGAQQHVTQVEELAVVRVLDVHHARAVLTATNQLAVHLHGALRADHGEGQHGLDLAVEHALLFVVVLVVERIDTDAILLQ